MYPRISTAYANANIALVKYWGKSDQALNIPAVSSLSMTLDNFGTSVSVEDSLSTRLVINGEEAQGAKQSRLVDFLHALKALGLPTEELCITSSSTIPIASGLASSAAFFAALSVALNHHFSWGLTAQALSTVARLGSASAARSLFSGFSALHGGTNLTHEDARAFSVTGPKNLSLLIAMVDGAEKHISSRQAMNHTSESSPFFKAFVEGSRDDFEHGLAALEAHQFETLGAIMEHSTLKMFATMWAAQPTIMYWQPATLALVNLIYQIRKQHGPIAFFTMDAGPQVKILTQQQHLEKVANIVKSSGLAQRLLPTKPGLGAYLVEGVPHS